MTRGLRRFGVLRVGAATQDARGKGQHMADDSTTSPHADTAYRRGTVLGLTVAEIFILLLFLLLLAFLTLAQDWEDERERNDTALAEARETLQAIDQWQDVVSEFETPSEVLTLRRQKERAERKAVLHERQAQTLRDALAKEDKAMEEAVRTAQEAEQRAADAAEELRVLGVKGHNPPCWYSIVPTGDGDIREKPHYTLNLAVFDEGIVIRRSTPPPGGADDDNGGRYADEAARLNLDALPYDTMLDDVDVLAHLQPIHQAGKDRRIRTYSCIFWVRVWDRTSANAKARWKHAHDNLIEGLFGAYTVRDDPWPPA